MSAPMQVRARRSAVALSALTRAINAVEKHLESLDGLPVRRSTYRLRELLGINEYALNSSIAPSALKEFSQTRDDHIAARISWITRYRTQARLADWRIARAVKLRQKTLRIWKTRRRDEEKK